MSLPASRGSLTNGSALGKGFGGHGLHLDDIPLAVHNKWQGELMAVEEFNERHAMRKITPYNFLRANRLFKRPI